MSSIQEESARRVAGKQIHPESSGIRSQKLCSAAKDSNSRDVLTNSSQIPIMRRSMHELQDKAIKAALSGDWESAVEYNLEILSSNPQNITALNRLGRAYTELGQKDAAKDSYEQVLKIDKYDSIASKNLKLLPHQKNNLASVALSDEDFIELPGITKSTLLIKVASRDILLSLACKQKLELVPRTRLVAILTEDKTCIGCLPDDLSLKLRELMKIGYSYTACLKGASDNTATVFIREIKRPKKTSASPSFSRSNMLKKSK